MKVDGDDEVLVFSWNAAVCRKLRTGRRVGGRRTLSRRHVHVAFSASLSSLGPIDREFEFYEFFSFLKFNEFYEFFFG